MDLIGRTAPPKARWPTGKAARSMNWLWTLCRTSAPSPMAGSTPAWVSAGEVGRIAAGARRRLCGRDVGPVADVASRRAGAAHRTHARTPETKGGNTLSYATAELVDNAISALAASPVGEKVRSPWF
jgi:hypothetical protein